MIVALETPRLLLRPLELADAEQTQRLFPHWEIVKYLNNRVTWPYPEGHASIYFRGFWIGLPWQGQGLMSEAVEAVNDYWFDVLGFPVLRAPKAVVNTASRRISEKNGMRVIAVDERDYVSGRYLTETWEITAEEWRERWRTLR